MNYAIAPILIFAGFVPSIIWLLIYLLNDCHPEPKHRIIKTFLMSLLLALAAAILEELFVKCVRYFDPAYLYENSKAFYAWAAFIEEIVKFLAVFLIAVYSVDFDEPIDAMIYMITAGLGFAALENILFLFDAFRTSHDAGNAIAISFQAVSKVWLYRFLGATLLHTLASAVLGYFLAVAWFYRHHSKKIIIAGIIMATLLHFFFNLAFIIFDPTKSQDNFMPAFFISSTIIVCMIVLVAILFYKIKLHIQREAAECLKTNTV